MKIIKNKFKITILKGIWRHLSKNRKRQLIFLPILISLAGISEIFSIASVIPFLTALTQGQNTNNLKLIQIFYSIFEPLEIIDPFVLSIGIFLFCVTISGGLRLLTIFSINLKQVQMAF